MRLKRNELCRTLVAGLVAGLGVAPIAFADGNNTPPPASAIESAKGTSDLMLATLVAALFQEFNETTAQNVPEGIASIGLIFNDANRDMRLVGTLDPLSENDMPADAFERTALGLALSGQPHTNVERVKGRWYYRRSIAIGNHFHTACVLCHANFGPGGPDTPPQWVGALMLRVPIRSDEAEED